MQREFVSPERGKKSFTCPSCGVLARQYSYSNPPDFSRSGSHLIDEPIATTICEHCNEYALWHEEVMVHPARGLAPPANPDIPEDVKADYEEAAAISGRSPKGAAALLRLAIQKLVVALGESGSNLNQDIGSLARKGLSPKVQQALDIVRVTGNNAVHPGQIETDDPEVVGNLFVLINVIVESMITVPERIQDLYGNLPESSRVAIEKRDGREVGGGSGG